MKKSALIAAFVVLVSLVVAGSSSATGEAGLRAARPLVVSNLLLPSAPLRDGRVHIKTAGKIALFDSPLAPYQTSDGMTVFVAFSDFYTVDPAVAQSYADFLGWLTHGPELNNLVLHIYTPAQISALCGEFSAACYAPAYGAFVSGEPTGGVPTEQALAHEYGHNIAAHRINPPWNAYDWGPKRWANNENVCANFASGAMFPGAEDPAHYMMNPGEGWAETYRRLNELRAGNWPDIGWNVVDSFFFPDATALSLANEDVIHPWTGPSLYHASGRLRRGGVRRYKMHPLDGPMTASVAGAPGTTISFVVGGRVAKGPARSIGGVVCGAPAVTVAVSSRRGGVFRLRLSEDDN